MKLLTKFIALALCLCLSIGLLFACDGSDAQEEPESITIYASFYPIYALAELLVEGAPNLQLKCLVQPQDGCLRDYSLSDWDLALLTRSADAIIAGGRGLESFEPALYSLGEDGPAVASVLYNLELATQKLSNDSGEESHWSDENPHIYMSVDGAVEIAGRIAANLAVLDPDCANLYEENLESTENRLKSLQKEMHELAGDLQGRKVIVMNEALVYLAQEYDLEMELCFARESGEGLYDRELEECLNLLKACEARVVLIERQAPAALRAALEATGFRVAALDVLSTRRADEGAEAYFAAQRENARALAQAFAADVDLGEKQ